MPRRILAFRLWPTFLLPQIVFAGIAWTTEPAWLINILNAVLVALAAGVSCAYSPAIYNLMFTRRPVENHDWLALGIFLSWTSIVIARVWSIAWRLMGSPLALINTHVISYYLFMSTCAAVFHLAAPGGVGGRVPTARWIKIGIFIAAIVFATILLTRTFDTANLLGDRVVRLARN